MRRIFFSIICMIFPAFTFAGFYMGATRVIYMQGSKGASITVGNKAAESVFLIQSWVDQANQTDRAENFLVTPPLFRLDGNQNNVLRIFYSGAQEDLPQDRESLFWLSIKAIPGAEKREENQLYLSYRNRIKLFYRPKGIKEDPDEAFKSVKFELHTNGSLLLSNPTPFFLTFTSVKANEKEVLAEPKMVAPFEKLELPLSSALAPNSVVSWQTINDYGGITPKESYTLN